MVCVLTNVICVHLVSVSVLLTVPFLLEHLFVVCIMKEIQCFTTEYWSLVFLLCIEDAS